MDKINKNPEVRFKGFTDDWVKRKFEEDIISIQTGTNLLGNTTNKGIPLIKMGNIQRGYFSFTKIEFLHKNIEVEKENIVNYGDFFFNTRNTLELVGKGATWTGESGKFAFNNNIARFVFKDIDTIFFNYFYNTKYMISEVQARAMGTTSVAAVYPKNLNSLKYILPSLTEQKQIGSFFQNLDNLITLHQKKYDKLVILKKAMLVKMFPKNGALMPEIRFKGFSANWEEMKLGETVPLRGGFAFKSDNFINNGIPIVKISNILPSGKIGGKFNNYKEQIADENYTLPNNAALLAMSGATTGKVSILSNPTEKKVYQNQRVGYFEDRNLVNYQFISAILRSNLFSDKINSILTTGAQPNISSKEIDFFEFYVPTDRLEQQKIGDYFKNLDNQIVLHKTQLEKLNNIKKACFTKMFVAQE